jgi:DNA-directed RNA polymerase subunit RPC12/RpoP
MKSNKLTKCPVCGSKDFEVDDRFTIEDYMDVNYSCVDCGAEWWEVWELVETMMMRDDYGLAIQIWEDDEDE